MYVWNMKTLPLMIQKLWEWLKFLWQMDKWDFMSPWFRESRRQQELSEDNGARQVAAITT